MQQQERDERVTSEFTRQVGAVPEQQQLPVSDPQIQPQEPQQQTPVEEATSASSLPSKDDEQQYPEGFLEDYWDIDNFGKYDSHRVIARNARILAEDPKMSDEDAYEWYVDFNRAVDSSPLRAIWHTIDSGIADENVQNAFAQVRGSWENVPEFSEGPFGLGSVAGNLYYAATDPLNYLGGGVGGKVAGMLAKAGVTKGLQVAGYLGAGAATEAAVAGGHDLTQQQLEKNVGLREDYDMGRAGTSALMGGGLHFAPVLAGGLYNAAKKKASKFLPEKAEPQFETILDSEGNALDLDAIAESQDVMANIQKEVTNLTEEMKDRTPFGYEDVDIDGPRLNSVNVPRISGSDTELTRIFKDLAVEQGPSQGRRTNDEILEAAKKQGFDWDNKQEVLLGAEGMTALRQETVSWANVFRASAEKLGELRNQGKKRGDAQYENMLLTQNYAKLMTQRLLAYGTEQGSEIGRALQVLRLTPKSQAENLIAIMKANDTMALSNRDLDEALRAGMSMGDALSAESAKSFGTKLYDKALSWYYANMLSNPDTFIANFGGTLGAVTSNLIENGIAAGVSKTMRGIGLGKYTSINPDEFAQRTVGMIENMRDAGVVAKYTFLRENPMGAIADRITKLEKQMAEGNMSVGKAKKVRQELRMLKTAKDEISNIDYHDMTEDALRSQGELIRTNNRALKIAKGVIPYFMNTAARTMQASDSAFKILGRNSALRSVVSRDIGKKFKPGTPEYKKELDKAIANPTNRQKLAAMKEAREAVFQNQNSLSEILERLNKIPVVGLISRYHIPFPRTPVNLLLYVANRTPVISSLTGGNKGLAWEQALGRQVMGTTIISMGAYMAANNMMGGPGTGDWRTDRTREFAGHTPYGIKDPTDEGDMEDAGFSLDISRGEPIATLLKIGSFIHHASVQAQSAPKEDRDRLHELIGIYGEMGQVIARDFVSGPAMLQQAAEFISFMSGESSLGKDWGDYVVDMSSNIAGTMTAPGILRRFVQAGDMSQVYSESMQDKIKKNYAPFLTAFGVDELPKRYFFLSKVRTEGVPTDWMPLAKRIATTGFENHAKLLSLADVAYPAPPKAIEGMALTAKERGFMDKVIGHSMALEMEPIMQAVYDNPSLLEPPKFGILKKNLQEARSNSLRRAQEMLILVPTAASGELLRHLGEKEFRGIKDEFDPNIPFQGGMNFGDFPLPEQLKKQRGE